MHIIYNSSTTLVLNRKYNMSIADSDKTMQQQKADATSCDTSVIADSVSDDISPDGKDVVVVQVSTKTEDSENMVSNDNNSNPLQDNSINAAIDDNLKKEEIDQDDASSIKSEGADEEDALFTNLEKKEEQEEAEHPQEQPIDAKAAPMLLQSAFEKGDVSMDDSAPQGEKKGEFVDEVVSEEHVVHQRVRKICR